jgi:purine-binding chemotaxis protein CheW
MPDVSVSLEKILRQRAERLAARPTEVSASKKLAILTFSLGQEHYGIEITSLAAAIALPPITPVPGSPLEVLGVIAWHRKILPLIHLPRLLGCNLGEEKSAYGLVLNRGDREGRQVGLRVGTLKGIEDIDPQWSQGGFQTRPYIKGVTPNHLIVLDPQALWSHPVFKNSDTQKRPNIWNSSKEAGL